MDELHIDEHQGSLRLPVMTWIRLVRVFHKVERAMTEYLRSWDLSPAQFDVIAQVGQAEGITQQELADRLLVTKGNICQLLNRLEQSDLVLRQSEGRANRLFLTARGRALFDQVVPADEAFLAGQLSGLSAEELRELHELLRKLDRSLA